MTEPGTYSERLGAISDAQFQAVAARFDLGRFLRAEPITSGILQALSAQARRHVAVALGTTLAEMQRLTSPFAGDFGVMSIDWNRIRSAAPDMSSMRHA
jgi:hypothetical protein